ncbi:MAG: hypothetical protein WC980_10695 [Candidatus Brocadiia bacterium]
MKTRKLGVLLGLLVLASLPGNAAMRYSWQTPVNQLGQADSYALPCEIVAPLVNTVGGALATYGVGKSTPLAQAGAVYWLNIEPAATAGDYVVFRDSATANSSSTAIAKFAQASTTGSVLISFNPPIAVANGLSINSSSGTLGVSVCIREADGGI